MRKLCQLAVVIMAVAFCARAHASTCPASAATQAAVVSAIAGCSSGNTVTLPVTGTYSISSSIALKCGVSMQGPQGTMSIQTRGSSTVPIWSTSVTFSATLRTFPFFTLSNCTLPMTISGIRFQNAPAFSMNGPINHFTFTQNACYNLPGGVGGNGSGSCGWMHAGNNSNPIGPDVNFISNDVGDANSCLTPTNVLMKAQPDQGGLCNGFMEQGQIDGINILNNSFFHLENGPNKVVCDGTGASCEPNKNSSHMNNIVIRGNSWDQIHRGQIEEQPQPSTGNDNEFNSSQHILNSNKISLGVSMPCCKTGATSPGQISSNNTFTNSEAPSAGDYVAFAFEFWGLGARGEHNLVQGYYAVGFSWGYGNSPWAMNYNTLQLLGKSPGNTNANGNSCTIGTNATPVGSPLNNGYLNNEECAQASQNLPTATGNVESTTVTQQTSFPVTITPPGGTASFPLTVTLTDAGYGSTSALPNGNTSIWYTLDGSTPAPQTGAGGNTSILCNPTGAISCTVSMPAAGTIKAVGMWGTGANTTSWTYGGWVPSAMTSQTYTGGGGQPTAATPVLTPASQGFTGSQSVSIADSTPGSTIYYTTDGSTPTTSSTVYSAPLSLTATTTVKSIAAAPGYINSAVGTATYTLGTPTLAGGHQANTGSVNTLGVGQPAIQQMAVGTYSDGLSHGNLPDSFGNSPVWSSSNAAILNVDPTGLVSCVGVGTANSRVSASPSGTQFNRWDWTCNAAPPPPPTFQSLTLATTGGVSSIGYQQTNQILATCHYSDSSTTSCNSPDSHGNSVTSWASSAPGKVSISGTGLATGVAIGSSNLTAVVNGTTSNPVLALGVTSTGTLVNAYLSPGSAGCNPGNTVQFAAKCHYTTGTDQDCSMTDIYGDAATAWATSASSFVTVGNVGSANPGRASCVANGSANITATINGATGSSASPVTVSAAAVTLTGVTVATTGGVTALLVGSTNQLKATCTYSDGSTADCTNTDAHGNKAGSWTSTTPSHATVNSTGLTTGVAAGTTTYTATAGAFSNSPALPLTVLAIPSGTYTITISGPVSFSGTVTF